MRAWFVFLIGRNLRICCLNFFNIWTSAVSWLWHVSPRIPLTSLRSLHFEVVLPHPSYSPHLTPSDFHLVGPLKGALRRRRFSDDDNDELKHSVRQELRRFTRPAHIVSRTSGKIVLITKENLWKNNVNFVKNALVIIVRYIITVIISFWETN
jgi:hypothetical protein